MYHRAVSETTSWRTLLGTHPATRALRQGQVSSPRVPLAFVDVPVPNKAFKRVVRDLEFDVAEIALMTFLMARSRGVPLRLLPVVVFSRNPLPYFVCHSDRAMRPVDMAGARLGVRSYSTTTAVWLRAVMAGQCGVSFDRAQWTTIEEGHVAGVPDPPNVRRAAEGADLVSMLREGALDAVIVDPVPTGEGFAPVVPDPDATYGAWQQSTGAQTVNHMICIRESLAHDEAAMRDLFDLFRESRALAGTSHDLRTTPLSLEANRQNLEVAIEAASAQHLLTRRLSVDDLVTDAIASLT